MEGTIGVRTPKNFGLPIEISFYAKNVLIDYCAPLLLSKFSHHCFE